MAARPALVGFPTAFLAAFLAFCLVGCSHGSKVGNFVEGFGSGFGSSKELEDKSHEELSHFALQMAMVVPALNTAIGSFEQDAMRASARELSAKDFESLMLLSQESFNSVSVYKKIHAKSLAAATQKESRQLAKNLADPLWQRFAQKNSFYYTPEGYEEVAAAMRKIDQEIFPLDLERALLAEKISRDSFDYKVVNILFEKLRKGSKVERFLYKKSLLVATYLATSGFTMEQMEELAQVRQGQTYQKYKEIFEVEISRQYDIFFEKLKAYVESKNAG